MELPKAGKRSALRVIWDFFVADRVFLVAFIIAVISVVFGHFTTRFFDYKVIFTVFGLMLVITGFRSTGLLRFLGQSLVKKSRTTRQLVRFTTLLTFGLAVFFTNDLTILTMLPLYLAITREIKNRRSVYIGAALIVPACHMGSTLFPFGNPHNLYLYSFYHIPNLEFFKGTGLLWLAGFIALNIACQFIDNDPIEINTKVIQFDKTETIVFVILMLMMIASVFGLIDFRLAVAIVAGVVLLYRPRLFAGVDYHLLLTFICFFLIVGNIASIHWLTDFIGSKLVGPQMAFLGTVIVSQGISNISSAMLISPFTHYGVSVVLGADVGGIGTLVASMATLIAYKVIHMHAKNEKRGFTKYFVLINLIFLSALTVVGLVIVSFVHI